MSESDQKWFVINKSHQSTQSRDRMEFDQVHSKKLEVEDNKVDIISTLPNDILTRIISFLPFESAAQTSLVSNGWKNLWKMGLVKDGTKEEAVCNVLNLVSNIHQHHELPPPSNNWGGLEYNFGQGNVLLVATAPKGILHLGFSAGKQGTSRQFGLILGRKRQICYHHQPSLSTTSNLKSVHLVSVTHVSAEMVSCLLSNIPRLESLALARCSGLQSIQIEGNRHLKKLSVLDCQHLVSIKLNFNFYYNLKSFLYRGRAVSLTYYNEDPLYYYFDSNEINNDWPFDLEDAMLDFRQGPGYYGIHRSGFKLILQSLTGVKTLTICSWVFKELICPELYLLGEGFCQLTELWWIDDLQEKFDTNALISFLKLCPQLTRLYITIDPTSYNTTKMNMCSMTVKGSIKLNHLKPVKLEGFENGEDEIKLAKQLKEEFQVEALIITKWDGTVRQLIKIDEQLKEGIDAYEFIEKRVENIHELCPKHVHMDL